MKGISWIGVAAVVIAALAYHVWSWDVGRNFIRARCSPKSVEDRMAEIEKKRPSLKSDAKAAGGTLAILVFKKERKVEVRAPGWGMPRLYAMTGFSGTLGPKLKEGDGQIPEGIYGIEYLNPNSLFHLSLKVSYPNEFDRKRASGDGRTDLGGDIMIHGGSATVGCIPIGDDAIEELFYLVAAVGRENVKLIIAPYDMRTGRDASLEKSTLPWYGTLCDMISSSLNLKIAVEGNDVSACQLKRAG